jgi:hypothetical protein
MIETLPRSFDQMLKQEKSKGRTGFSCPFHWQQILVWIVTTANIGLVFTILAMQKSMPRGVIIPGITVFVLLIGTIILVNYLVTATLV